jgi:hypothetical protein
MISTAANPEVGKWNQDLFLEYKSAPAGPRKRSLLNMLLKVNTPLVKILVAQLSGTTDERAPMRGGKRAGGKVPYADEMPWEDLMSAGLFGMAVALERFDPQKGKIAGFSRWHILYQIQKAAKLYHFVHVPDKKWDLRPAVSFSDDEAEIDRLAGAEEIDEEPWRYVSSVAEAREVAERLGYTENRVHTENGVPKKVISIPGCVLTAMDRFIKRCVFGQQFRADPKAVYNAYRVQCRLTRETELPRSSLIETLAPKGARLTTVRKPVGPRAALAGIKLRNLPATF